MNLVEAVRCARAMGCIVDIRPVSGDIRFYHIFFGASPLIQHGARKDATRHITKNLRRLHRRLFQEAAP